MNLVPGFHRVYVRLRGFPGDRVPAVRFADGSRAQGTRPLARALDAIQPEPRLVPDDPRADLQIATSLALVEYRLDVRESLRRRPAAELMERVLPERG